MTIDRGIVDVHSHFLAEAHEAALRRGAGPGDDGIELPPWSTEKSLAVMDAVGIEVAVLSPISPPPAFADEADARATARAVNEELAALVAAHPQRYGAVAMLPLPYVDAALDELAHALDQLGLDGVHLFSSYGGKYLGHPDLRPLLAELNRRGVVVVTHPTTPVGTEQVQVGLPGPTLEFVFDTTRTAADLLYSGALADFPDITWILPHAGGTLLTNLDRLARSVHIMRNETDREFGGIPATDDEARTLLRRLYFDVTWNTYAPVLGALADLIGPDHLLFGTDMPFESQSLIDSDIAALNANPGVDDSTRHAVARDNALRLFPGVAARLVKAAV